jgi:predicted dehydrogenase
MIRLGLMGCGVVASYGHVPAIGRTAGCKLVSIFEPDTGRLIDAKDRYKVDKGFTDPELFFQSGIDAVVVTSPAPCHLDNVRMAARFGKPVLCEKPLAMNEAESVEMIRVMRDAGLPLYVGFTYRFSPVAMDIKRLVAEGAIGKVRSLRLIYLWDCHGKYDCRTGSDRPNPARHGRMVEGGPMVDCGVHQIDLARWWLGAEVVRATGAGAWVDGDEHAAPDHTYLHLDHADGAHTMVEMSYSYGHTSKDQRCQFVYELIGSDGLIRYDRQARVFELVNRAGTQRLHWTEEKNFEGMYAEFVKALQTGQAGNMPTADDGLAATRIARVATEEMAKGRVVPR